MKQLKFNCVEIMLSLLNMTKTTTIRKSCKYIVGDICEVVWTDSLPQKCPSCACLVEFERIHKRRPNSQEILTMGIDRFLNGHIIGKVKIISVEKIEINANPRICWKLNGYGKTREMDWETKLAESEGFNSVKAMFDYLEKYAPEIKESPMPFWLIRFKWVIE